MNPYKTVMAKNIPKNKSQVGTVGATCIYPPSQQKYYITYYIQSNIYVDITWIKKEAVGPTGPPPRVLDSLWRLVPLSLN
jgi:hypothetical protein